MTVNSGVNKISYIGSSSQTLYPIPFSFIKKSDIKVSIYTSANVFVENWVYSTQYIIDANNNVSILSGYEIDNTKKILIIREVDYTQENVYREGGDFPAKSTETSFDKSAMMCSQLAESIGRSLLLPEISSISGLSLPTPGAGKALKWNANEDGLINTTDDVDEIVTLATAQATIATTKASEASASASSAAGSVTTAQGLINGFGTTVTNATTAFNTNATTKTNDFNTNATAKQALVDASATSAQASATSAQASATSAEQYAQDTKGFAPIGSFISIPCTADYIPDGCLPCDGSEYSQSQFPALWTNYLTSSPVKLQTCTYAEYATSIATYGSCAKFAVDTTNNTFKVPTIKDGAVIQQALSNTELGKAYNAGLPNITGSTGINIGDNTSNTGMFTTALGTSKGYISTQNISATLLASNASLSNPIYGNSTTVQMNAITARVFVVIANAQINQSQMDWSAWATSLAGKANTDLSNVASNIDYVVETYTSGTSWYRKYKSGWVEQGGATTITNITLLKAMANTSYSVLLTYNRNSNSTYNISFSAKTTTNITLVTADNATVYWRAEGQGV